MWDHPIYSHLRCILGYTTVILYAIGDWDGYYCALCLGVVDWHNCGTVLGALESGWGLVVQLHSLYDIIRGNGAPLMLFVMGHVLAM